jgi:histidyl-tRNA synthetase
MAIQSIQGMADLLPEEISVWQMIEQTARELFARYGYREIRTPMLEPTDLFVRSVGASTDIVEKEMYTFSIGDHPQTLRPEGTAAVFRAYLQHHFHKKQPFQKLYYLGPMFRHERPQAGRLRQFHQVGVEAIGATDPILDAEVLILGAAFFRELGLSGFEIQVNSIGCPNCRPAYLDLLRRAAEPLLPGLCKNCQRRFHANALRLLDCKEAACRKALAGAPRIAEHLCAGCDEHHRVWLDTLRAQNQPFRENPFLVRGLDYYTRSVFEYTHDGVGARNAIGGGGRYDGLSETLGGPPLGAIGFALGIETTLLALKSEGKTSPDPRPAVKLLVVTPTPDTRPQAFALLQRVRVKGIAADIEFENKSLKAQMRRADREGIPYVCFVGSDELKQNQIRLKELRQGTERNFSIDDLLGSLEQGNLSCLFPNQA